MRVHPHDFTSTLPEHRLFPFQVKSALAILRKGIPYMRAKRLVAAATAAVVAVGIVAIATPATAAVDICKAKNVKEAGGLDNLIKLAKKRASLLSSQHHAHGQTTVRFTMHTRRLSA